MNLLRHFVGGLLIIVLVSTLFGGMYSNLKSHYGWGDTYTGIDEENLSFSTRIENLGIVQSLDSFQEAIFQIINPQTPFDVVGGIMSAAFGVLGLLGGLIILPVEILGIVTNFYQIPPIVSVIVGVLTTVYAGFIILSARLRGDI